ncbi:hypothetical protein FOA43_002924 [Brettanomyces nanus]|uniref:non-specific serine/threonine protein kinase n=1 Tax=Eeniella nana TaxID=13502 RepID=A0A875S3N8_EENNA|nr:uncharacterized protein FOA43_002924 [Brettanomyces nanus]QPG75568.1 hypothetical protein FOA43_002924 [Brettanomyces nanus]
MSCKRDLIEERAAYTKRTEDYIQLIKRFAEPEVSEVGNYSILREIGSGAFGQIYLGYHKFLRVKVCLKRGTRDPNNPQTSDNMMKEFYYLKEFGHHPYISRLYEVILTDKYVYLVLEYYPEGDLFDYLSKRGRIPIDEALKIFTQLVGAVYYMHRNGCCHRDLKLENILLDRKFNVKLSDFGFTREIPLVANGTGRAPLTEICGTEAYMSPELIQKKSYSGIKTDIWALGVILYTMVAGEMPFDDSLPTEQIEAAVLSEEPVFSKPCFAGSLGLVVLLRSLLAKPPENRPASLADVLTLPLLQPYGGQNQIEIVHKLIYGPTDKSLSLHSLSNSDRALLKEMTHLGFDKDCLKRSVRNEMLDPLDGFWMLLKEKKQRKAERKKRKRRSRSMLRLSGSKSFIDSAKQYAFGQSSNAENVDSTEPASASATALATAASAATTSCGFPNDTSTDGPLMSHHPHHRHELPKPPVQPVASISEEKEVPKPALKEKRLSSIKKKHSVFSLFALFLTSRKNSVALFGTRGSRLSTESSSRESILRKIFPSSSSSNNSTREEKRSYDDSRTHQNSDHGVGVDNRHVGSRRAGSAVNDHNRGHSRAIVSFDSRKRNLRTSVVVIEPEKHAVGPPSSSSTQDNYYKRSVPTRPGSVISSYSIQTTISETSNGSGYITGYSTDNHATGGNSVAAAAQGVPGSPRPARPGISRGISDWSVGSRNVSSQAESPNSSLTGISRTTSMDSSSRSSGGILRSKKKSSSSNSFPLHRRDLGLKSKINAKWSFSMANAGNNLKRYRKHAPKQIIEEEEPEMADSEEMVEDDDLEKEEYNNTENDEELVDEKALRAESTEIEPEIGTPERSANEVLSQHSAPPPLKVQ